MAGVESTPGCGVGVEGGSAANVSADELGASAEAVWKVYDLALELSTLLVALTELPTPPRWAYPLSSMAERVTVAADTTHVELLRLADRLRRAEA